MSWFDDHVNRKRVVTPYSVGIPKTEVWYDRLPSSGPADSIVDHDPRGVSDRLISHGNAYKDLGKSNKRIGGDFLVSKREVLEVIPSPYTYAHSYPSGSTRDFFYGHWTAYDGLPTDTSDGNWPTREVSDSSDLDAFGTTAISIVEPTNPLAGLTVTLGELKREGLPSVPGISTLKGKKSLAASAGGEYLNKEFGWDPLIGDIRKVMHVANNQQKIIDQYARNSGRKMKREFRLPVEETVTVTTGQSDRFIYPRGAGMAALLVTPPKWRLTHTRRVERWFKGCFTYHLPPLKLDGDNFERNRRLANKLYGVGITPEVIWDLTPWTWAIDWFSNAGDVIHNVGAFLDNGLVMQYGYVMETIQNTWHIETYDIRTKRSEDPTSNDGTNPALAKRTSCSTTLRATTKSRRTATPYGFGLNWDGFSSFQLGILGALGLSRRG